jgi:hypothetical protein
MRNVRRPRSLAIPDIRYFGLWDARRHAEAHLLDVVRQGVTIAAASSPASSGERLQRWFGQQGGRLSGAVRATMDVARQTRQLACELGHLLAPDAAFPELAEMRTLGDPPAATVARDWIGLGRPGRPRLDILAEGTDVVVRFHGSAGEDVPLVFVIPVDAPAAAEYVSMSWDGDGGCWTGRTSPEEPECVIAIAQGCEPT